MPPLLQPKSAEFPLGVSTLTFTDSGSEMTPVVSVTFSCVLLTTVVASVAPLNTITDEETKWLPVRFREKLDGNCENAMVIGDTESRTGAGRALPQSGFRELQLGSSSSKTRSPRRVVVDRKQVALNERCID